MVHEHEHVRGGNETGFARTDGDAIVFFRNANVIHTGDIYFAGIYPFIDNSSHGSIDGMMAAANHILSMVDDPTQIIPGHGPMSNKKELTQYAAMLSKIRVRVKKLMTAGNSLDDIIKLNPTREFDQEWGDGFFSPDKFTAIVYNDLSE